MTKKIDTIPAELVFSTEPIRVPAEIVPTDALKLQRAITRLVEQKVAEALKSEDSVFQPWFQSRDINAEIRRRQTVAELQKWSHYFERWACLICKTEKKPHASLGMCSDCYTRTKARLKQILKEHAPPAQSPFADTERLAREALAPSIEILAKNKKGERT